jgi:O-glycosyl hydrolase
MSYTETSWITQSSTNGPIYLIPRIQQKITQHYPNTRLSFSEWNYGGGGDISGTVASADVLGIFGSSGIDMAMMWPMSSDESFTYAAFKAYRDYDGKGAQFGDTSIDATTTDVPKSSVYASLQSADASKVVIVAINKALSDKIAGIRIYHSTVYTKATVYTITQAGGATPVPGPGLTSVATNAFRYTMPAQSVSIIVPSP